MEDKMQKHILDRALWKSSNRGDEWAKRRMAAWKALPAPRVSWEQFKRTWKENK